MAKKIVVTRRTVYILRPVSDIERRVYGLEPGTLVVQGDAGRSFVRTEQDAIREVQDANAGADSVELHDNGA